MFLDAQRLSPARAGAGGRRPRFGVRRIRQLHFGDGPRRAGPKAEAPSGRFYPHPLRHHSNVAISKTTFEQARIHARAVVGDG